MPRLSAGSRITRTVFAGSQFSWTVVSAGSKRSRTVSAEAKYDGQSLQEAKICGLVYTLYNWLLWEQIIFKSRPHVKELHHPRKQKCHASLFNDIFGKGKGGSLLERGRLLGLIRYSIGQCITRVGLDADVKRID